MTATEEAVRLKAQGLTVGQIAERQGVREPCVRKRLGRGASPRCGQVPRRPNAKAAGPLPPVVNRDPCPRCEVRADIGCRHSRAPLGWRVGL